METDLDPHISPRQDLFLECNIYECHHSVLKGKYDNMSLVYLHSAFDNWLKLFIDGDCILMHERAILCS